MRPHCKNQSQTFNASPGESEGLLSHACGEQSDRGKDQQPSGKKKEKASDLHLRIDCHPRPKGGGIDIFYQRHPYFQFQIKKVCHSDKKIQFPLTFRLQEYRGKPDPAPSRPFRAPRTGPSAAQNNKI